jgi:FAD/FMN-containing dehydrogenase
MTLADPKLGTLVNDVHSRLNPTRVTRVLVPRTPEEVCRIVRASAAEGWGLSVGGGRHAMGGQAFREDRALLDTRGLNRVLEVDREQRRVRVQAGVDWRALVDHLNAVAPELAIVQKPTGADRMTLGGSVAANVHGRGLGLAPLVDQVHGLELIDAQGSRRRVSSTEDAERFALVVGGYGQAGVVTEVDLRLAAKQRVRRQVEVRQAQGAVQALEQARDSGALFGDLQLAIDPRSGDLFRRGVMATYHPVPNKTPLAAPHALDDSAWRRLIGLAHSAPGRAFEAYAEHYRATHGQVYDSDRVQLSTYVPDYHLDLDRGAPCSGSEMITELYAPRAVFDPFLEDLRAELIGSGAQPIYATLRLIERDALSALAWAREPWACLVLNLHVDHDPRGREQAAARFRGLIDVALGYGGSFYLTYHRWATADQLQEAHPGLKVFLRRTRELDPARLFESDWSAHLRDQLGE